MLKAIWMSDPHFASAGNVLGHDPRVRLHAAVTHINNYHADAQFAIISGDMVNRGSKADYDGLRKQLADLCIPVLPMVGNHDNREMFRAALPVPESCMNDFVQYTVPTDNGLIVCLDTQRTASDAGEFCDERRDWLRHILQTAGSTPVFIFMHHPPMPLGLPMQDTDNLQDGEAFLDLIAQYDCVKNLFIGHVHRPITGTVRGIPFATMRSVLYQAPPPRPEWNWETFEPSEEAPNLGVLSISDDVMLLQYEQFCPHGVGTSK